MTDYDATVAFDHVLAGLSILTCQCMGLPRIAGLFMFHLLQNMSFHLMTGFGKSVQYFHNNEDPSRPGQGVLQGSSSAAPIFIFNSDVSLTTYCKQAHEASFTHPISGTPILDRAIQCVDNKMQLLNPVGCDLQFDPSTIILDSDSLISKATYNSNLWNDIIWLSGGNLNLQKCFYYSFLPTFNFKKMAVTYKPLPSSRPIMITNHMTSKQVSIEQVLPTLAQRTLGVILAPDGSAAVQIPHTTSRAREFYGKLLNSSLSRKAKRTAVQFIIEPSISYPLLATYFLEAEIKPLESIMSTMKCAALGLNSHFP
jgi:hypothetical protein